MVRQYHCITAALILSCLAWLVLKTWARDHGYMRRLRQLAAAGALVCLAVIVRLTLWRTGGEQSGSYDFRLFWSYGRWITEYNTLDIILQVYFNIELYVPLGLCLHSALPRRYKRWVPVLIGLGLSMLTESLQGLLSIGLCELDDIWHNTLGAVLGAGISDTIDVLGRRRQGSLPRRYWDGLRQPAALHGLLPCVLTVLFFLLLRMIRMGIVHQ